MTATGLRTYQGCIYPSSGVRHQDGQDVGVDVGGGGKLGVPQKLLHYTEQDALQEQLGRRDINTTRIYLHLSDEDVRREVGKIQF